MTQDSFSRYGHVFDLFSDIVFVLDGELKIVDHNAPASDATGFTPKDLHLKPIFELIPKQTRNEFKKALHRFNHRPTELKLLKADQTEFDVEVQVKELHSGKTSFTVLIAKDITDKKQKDLDLLRFSNVIHHTINPIQITDANGVMVYVNPAFERVSGYPKEELIGRNPSVLKSGKYGKQFWAEVWGHILARNVWRGQLENRRKDGNPFYSDLVVSPIVDDRGAIVGFLGAHRDITEQKVLEQQLVRSQKMESIGTLAAGIAHEVGNPLTSISSLVQVIERTTSDLSAKEKLDLIKSQINRIAHIIRELVDFSRPTTHIIQPSDINKVVKDALNIVQYGKKVKDIVFDVKLDEGLPKLEIVPDQLQQVFINILINSVDSLDGRLGKITIQSERRGNTIAVLVSDSGKGILEEDLDVIFEPFYTTKEVGKGTGLGLWVSYGIVKNFQGDIQVKSEPGKGTTFTVVLPVKGN
ncbi:MAG TPA: PAS domain S-box protein [Bacteroidota bacterium]|nr:PAS domain S-box protein [Bacteroidota bacterium]